MYNKLYKNLYKCIQYIGLKKTSKIIYVPSQFKKYDLVYI